MAYRRAPAASPCRRRGNSSSPTAFNELAGAGRPRTPAATDPHSPTSLRRDSFPDPGAAVRSHAAESNWNILVVDAAGSGRSCASIPIIFNQNAGRVEFNLVGTRFPDRASPAIPPIRPWWWWTDSPARSSEKAGVHRVNRRHARPAGGGVTQRRLPELAPGGRPSRMERILVTDRGSCKA